jgi:GDP-4-dehydro-6-deoxy-D-mannose reductase
MASDIRYNALFILVGITMQTSGRDSVRVLITGVGGFVGRHLAKHLMSVYPDAEIHGAERSSAAAVDQVELHVLDLRDPDAVNALMHRVQPQQIYHLAAQAFVPRSFSDPWETLENNIRAQLNLTLASIDMPEKPRMLVISSAEIYGVVTPDKVPMREDLPPQPTSPYSVSKVAQDMLAQQYYHSHKLPLMRARPFNHFGPGQNERFVAPAFAMQVARIEAGKQDPVIEVGDLSAQRDFTDVRDIVAAYRLIVERGTPGAVYNVASGEAHSIQTLLDTLLGFVDVDIKVRIDKTRLRPVHIPILLGDATRLREETGWQPAHTFENSLRDVLDDCRQRVQTHTTQ